MKKLISGCLVAIACVAFAAPSFACDGHKSQKKQETKKDDKTGA